MREPKRIKARAKLRSRFHKLKSKEPEPSWLKKIERGRVCYIHGPRLVAHPACPLRCAGFPTKQLDEMAARDPGNMSLVKAADHDDNGNELLQVITST